MCRFKGNFSFLQHWTIFCQFNQQDQFMKIEEVNLDNINTNQMNHENNIDSNE